MLKHIRQDALNRRRYPGCTRLWCDLTRNPLNHLSEKWFLAKMQRNCNDHWSNGEHRVQEKPKRGQFVWPSKMQAERRRAVSRATLAQDQMEITQPRTEFSLEVWHRLQSFSPTRVKARSYKTKPGLFARSLQENFGPGSERALTSWAMVTCLQRIRVWAHSKAPSWAHGDGQAGRCAVPIISSKPGAQVWFLPGFINTICSRRLKLTLGICIQVKNVFQNPQWNKEETRRFQQDCEE